MPFLKPYGLHCFFFLKDLLNLKYEALQLYYYLSFKDVDSTDCNLKVHRGFHLYTVHS